jgi:2-dehydro-3-deoxyphosphogluconate aldolase / (4S)-4-hydroxy-2-oxoglutarate aldolase
VPHPPLPETSFALAPLSQLRQTWLERLTQERLVAVLRVTDPELGWQCAHTAAAAGIHLIEITWNSTAAAELIPQLAQALPNCWIGSGTILDLAQLEAVIATGAKFLFMPHTDPQIIQAGAAQQIPMIPGAFSPSEIVSSWQAGAAAVKVFPIETLGGTRYLQHLRGPLGHIPLIPTGGIDCNNATQFLQAGAVAVGLGSHLFPTDLVKAGAWAEIQTHLQQFVQMLRAVG